MGLIPLFNLSVKFYVQIDLGFGFATVLNHTFYFIFWLLGVSILIFDRPFSDDELRNNAPQVLTCNDLQREVAVSQNIAGKHIDRVFTFDKVK